MKKVIIFLLATGTLMCSCAKKDALITAAGAAGTANKLTTLGSPVGDVVGKVTVGYQGWFSAAGNGVSLTTN